jgi:uncharacterized protein (UPF0210 family)
MEQSALFSPAAHSVFERAGFEVQTTRLATSPFPSLLPDCATRRVVEFAQKWEETSTRLGFDYLSLGPALPSQPESYATIPEVIEATNSTFVSGMMAGPQYGIDMGAVQACAAVIRSLSGQDPNGFSNLYFAALANVSPGAPFFPAAYHDGGRPMFAIATEAADLAVVAFNQTTSLATARQNLRRLLEDHATRLCRAASSLQDRLGGEAALRFGGIDYSLAPFPSVDLSLGTAMERLGVPKVGLHGSLAVAAILAETIDRADFPRVGFSGMMLPVLEDATLAARAAEGLLTIKDLLLYSAVCGTGLDTVPLPGDTTQGQLAAVLLDISALAMRLDKPLTARLMPIPGKQAGDPTNFNFDFFANSRVMPFDAEPLNTPLDAGEVFTLGNRSV